MEEKSRQKENKSQFKRLSRAFDAERFVVQERDRKTMEEQNPQGQEKKSAKDPASDGKRPEVNRGGRFLSHSGSNFSKSGRPEAKNV